MATSDSTSSPVRQLYTPSSRSGVGAVLRDLGDGLARSQMWRSFAWNEIQKRYRRSLLGLAWIVVSYYIFVLAISIFFAGFSAKRGEDFVAYVAIGYAGYTYLIANIMDGCGVFKSARTWIKSTPLPYSTHIYKNAARSLFVFGIQLTAAIVILPFLGWRPSWIMWQAIPALMLFVINALWLQLFFGLLATRWRDVSHLFTAVTRILFFTTPILWVYDERTGLRKLLAGFNPLTHFLEVFREPLMGKPAALESWLVVLGCTVVGWALALFVASRMQRRLPFWV